MGFLTYVFDTESLNPRTAFAAKNCLRIIRHRFSSKDEARNPVATP
jgi:hypothetical protein